MKKRGQIFILAALILILVIFLLTSQSNFIRERLFADKFEDIIKNYEVEGSNLINSVLEDQANPNGDFELFSNSFAGYSTTQDPNIGTIYVLSYDGKTNIGVYNMNVEVKTTGGIENCISEYDASVSGEIGGSSFDISSGACSYDYEDINQVEITTADGFTYTFDIESGKPQLNIVVKKDEQGQTKVYYKNE